MLIKSNRSISFVTYFLFLAYLINQEADGQTDITLELLQTLQDRIDAVDQASQGYQTQINQLSQRLQDQIVKETGDFNQLSGRADSLQDQIVQQGARILQNEDGLAAANGRIGALEATVADLTLRVEKIEAVNKIWRSNFQVVNRTFAELRKKIKFVVPLIRLPNVNYVYIVPNSNIKVTNVNG